MTKEKFILVSLQEEKAKKLAQVISNQSCTKILDYLAEKDHATESEISKELNIPISTVHYNLQQLTEAKMVSVEEFHYSQKGKEVNHYKLANQYIIIAPKSTYGIKEKLKSLFTLLTLSLGGALFIQLYNKTTTQFARDSGSFLQTAAPMAEKAVEETVAAAPIAADIANQTAKQINPALWFLYGCIFIILVWIILELIKYWRSKK